MRLICDFLVLLFSSFSLQNKLLQLKLINIESDEFKCNKDEEFQLYARYQTKVHNDPPADMSEFNDFLCRTPIKVSNVFDVQVFLFILCALLSLSSKVTGKNSN